MVATQEHGASAEGLACMSACAAHMHAHACMLPAALHVTAQAAFVTKLKGDFEALSLAIANLPVGLIPFPEVAKAALQQLNADVVHGVTSGALDIGAISADREAVAAALGGLGSEGARAPS